MSKRIRKVRMLTDNPFLNMYELDAVKRNGQVFSYYYASRGRGEELEIYTHQTKPDGVAIYGVYGEKHDKIVLVRQFRYPINDYIYELPAGLIDAGEDPQETGIREFREETGLTLTPYTGGDSCFRRPFYMTVGLTDESIVPVFGFASGDPGQSFQEDTEDIKTVIADRDEVRRILREEKVAMKCALLLTQFLHAEDGNPFGFLTM